MEYSSQPGKEINTKSLFTFEKVNFENTPERISPITSQASETSFNFFTVTLSRFLSDNLFSFSDLLFLAFQTCLKIFLLTPQKCSSQVWYLFAISMFKLRESIVMAGLQFDFHFESKHFQSLLNYSA